MGLSQSFLFAQSGRRICYLLLVTMRSPYQKINREWRKEIQKDQSNDSFVETLKGLWKSQYTMPFLPYFYVRECEIIY